MTAAHDLGNSTSSPAIGLLSGVRRHVSNRISTGIDLMSGRRAGGRSAIGAVNLSEEGTAMKWPSCRRNEYRRTIETAAPHDDPSSKLPGKWRTPADAG